LIMSTSGEDHTPSLMGWFFSSISLHNHKRNKKIKQKKEKKRSLDACTDNYFVERIVKRNQPVDYNLVKRNETANLNGCEA
jgi:hypothetical protein